jgi:hypothetical protein
VDTFRKTLLCVALAWSAVHTALLLVSGVMLAVIVAHISFSTFLDCSVVFFPGDHRRTFETRYPVMG